MARILAKRTITALSAPHTLAFILTAAMFWATRYHTAPWMWKRYEWLDKYSGMHYAVMWFQNYLPAFLLSVLVVGVFGWWVERRLAGRPVGMDGRLTEKPITFVYVVALVTMQAATMAMPHEMLKLDSWISSIPGEWLHLPLWEICRLLFPGDWSDVFLIGTLGWMVEKRIGSLGMAMTWLPLAAVKLPPQIMLDATTSGLSGVYFPLMGAAAFLVPWIRVPVPFTKKVLSFPFLALCILVYAVDTWRLWGMTDFLFSRGDPTVYNQIFIVLAHTVGALLGLGVAAYFRAKLRPRPDLVGQQGGMGAAAPTGAGVR